GAQADVSLVRACWQTGMVMEVVGGELSSLSLVELAVARLKYEILSGATDPGERLVEQHLTRRLGISRAPLREALRLLAEQGLVEHTPRRGSRVATRPTGTSPSCTRSATSSNARSSRWPCRSPTRRPWPACGPR